MRSFFLFILAVCFHPLWAQPDLHQGIRFVNSEYDEQHPVISGDGETLYFTIGNHPSNAGGKKDPGDIWISKRVGGQWSAPVHAGQALNNRAYNAVAGISADGRRLFLHGHYDRSGDPARSQGISVSTNSGQGWSQPSNIAIPYYRNRSATLSGSISYDGTVFVFSAESYGTHGVEDIYVSLFENGRWMEPRNLGPGINTQFQELSPSLSPDKRTLYFSTNGRRGSGSFDVFKATRVDETWTQWAAPEPVGTVNSAGRELYFRLDPSGTYAIFTTTRDSDGYGDIRIHHPAEPLASRDTTIQTPPPVSIDTVINLIETLYAEDSLGDHVVLVHGKIINAKTGEPVDGRVTFFDAAPDTLSAAADSDGYRIRIPSASEYRVAIEAKGFISAMQTLDINTYEMNDLEMNFTLQPAEVGTTVNLENVLFAQSRTDILPESYPELDLVVRFLKANPTVRIELSGHTDGRGVPADNLRLSQARVDRVKEYLVSKGIASRRISGKGYGGSRPISGNDTEESRRLNRRVEFTIKRS